MERANTACIICYKLRDRALRKELMVINMYKKIFSVLITTIMLTNLSAFARLSEVDGVYKDDFEGYDAGADIITDKTLIKEHTKFEPELDEVNGSSVMVVNSASGADNIIYTNSSIFNNELNIIKFKLGADSSSKLNWGSTSSLVFSHTNGSDIVVNDYIFDFAYSLIRHKENGTTEKGICAFSSKKMYDVEIQAAKAFRNEKYYYDVTYIVSGISNNISFETTETGTMRIGFKSTAGNKLYVDDLEAYGFTLVRPEVNIANRADVSVKPEIIVEFSDSINTGTLMPGDMLVGSVMAESIEEIGTNRYRITLSSLLEKNTEYTLDLSGVRDNKGNSLKNTEFNFKTKNSAVILDNGNVVNTSKTKSENILIVTPEYENGSMVNKSILDFEIYPDEEISLGIGNCFVLTSDYKPVDSTVFVDNTGEKSDEFTAYFDINTQKLIVSGKTKAGYADELMSVCVNDESGNTDYIGVMKTAESGYFSAECVPTSSSGVYSVSLRTMQEEFTATVAVRLTEDIDDLLDVINSKDESAIKVAFTEYKDVLSVDLDLYNQIEDKSFIAKELVKCVTENGSYKSVEKLVEDIKILSLIYSIKDKEDMYSVFSPYESLVMSSEDDAYVIWQELSADNKNEVLQSVTGNKTYNPDIFAEEVYVESLFVMIAASNKYIDVKNAIEQYPDLLGIDLDDYNKAGKPTSVAKGLTGKKWDIDSFENKFDELVEAAEKGSSGGSGSGGSGGGSGLSGSIPTAKATPKPLSTPAPESGPEFSDMEGASWAEEAVYSLCKRGILDGYDDGTFRPNEKITREEFATLIVRYLGLNTNEECDFDDVLKTDWFYGYIAAAKSKGIISGISDTQFGTGKTITRQDASVMLYNIGMLEADAEAEPEFSDIAEIADYAVNAISALSFAGVIDGNPDGTFSPTGSLTRAQAAKLIYAYDNAKSSNTVEDTESSSTQQKESIETELLIGLGIIDKETSDNNATVTRAEFAGYMIRFLNMEGVSGMNDGSYADVTQYTENADAIYYLKSVNIMSGDEDGNFYPDLPITNKQAAVAVAGALGYSSVPGDIENHAAALGVIGINNESLTYADMMSGFYKALEKECVVTDYGSSESLYELKDDYLLETFGISKDKGIVKSNSLTTLDGTGSASANNVLIANHSLINNGYAMDEMLGMQVDYYYISGEWHKNTEDGDVLVCAFPTKQNEITEIFARDIIDFDGRTLEYETGNRSKSIIINSDIDVIYNGVACPDYDTAMLSPATGKITYIENGSGVDCVKIETYTNGIVTLSTEEYIYLKNSSKIEFGDFGENELFLFDKDGNSVNTIPVDSVLSMYYSDDEDVLKAVYSTDVLEGAQIQSVSNEYIVVDGQEYYVSKLYTGWENTVKDMGSSRYKLYLDAYGEIAKIEKAAGGKAFGFVIDTYDDESGEGKWVRMLVEDGAVERLECNAGIKINGKKTAPESIEDKLIYGGTIKQLVTYKLDSDGRISEINTAANRDSYTGSVTDKSLDDFKISYKLTSSEYYKTATTVFGVSCPVDELTKVFFVADNPQGASDDYYWTGSISSLINDEQAEDAVGYNTSSKMGNAEAMVIYGAGSSGSIGNETRIAVVTNIESAVNEEGEARERVTFITAGKQVAYNISPDLDISEYNLSEGDLLRFAIDRYYEVSEIEMIGDLKKDGSVALKYGESANYNNTTNSGGAVFRIVSGSVYDYEDGLLCLSKGDINGINLQKPQFEYYRGISNAFMCVIDGDDINIGTVNDMIKYVDDPENYSKLFITTRYGAVVDVVVYK